MVVTLAETMHNFETIQLPRRPVPFVGEILRLGSNQQIVIPYVDYSYFQRQHGATENWLLTQTVRHNSPDTTGILAPLIGYTEDPTEVAAIAASCAQRSLDELVATKGMRAKSSMLQVLFEGAEPTLDDLLNLDRTWGLTVNAMKFEENPAAAAFRMKNVAALQRLATERASGRIALLAQRECDNGGYDGGWIANVTEADLLPRVDMRELDKIVPLIFSPQYSRQPGSQPDAIRLLREGGKVGNDIFRDILSSISEKHRLATLQQHQQSLP